MAFSNVYPGKIVGNVSFNQTAFAKTKIAPPKLRVKFSLHKKDPFDVMEELGIVQARVYFDGGNDSGGANRIEITKTDGSEEELKYTPDKKWNYETKTHIALPITHEEQRLNQLQNDLCKPIYDKWGSFAGDFYVEGTLVWNVETRKRFMEGSESFTEYKGFHEEL